MTLTSGILVVAESRGGKLANVTLESITRGRELATALGGPLSVLVAAAETAPLVAQAARYGAQRVYTVESSELATYRPGPFTDAATAAVQAAAPAVMLFAGSADGRDVAASCAARLDAGLLVDATALDAADGRLVATHPCFGGSVLAQMEVTSGPAVVAVRTGSCAREEAPAEPEVVPLAVEFAPRSLLSTIADVVCENAGIMSLEEAPVIVTGGRGVGGPEGFAVIQELADELGAAVGASRAVVDAGWKHHQFQVGQTGKTVSPQLYIACGLSGSIQHRAGMQTSQCIVAVNKDADAPIFSIADFGVVGDLFTVVPALTEEIRRRKAAS
jgi:electron transfer flavoprotein alpha subunit